MDSSPAVDRERERERGEADINGDKSNQDVEPDLLDYIEELEKKLREKVVK
jgi:hypothetical protein